MDIRGNKNDPRFNDEGYSDYTAFKAIKNIDDEDYKRFKQLLRSIFELCELSGFKIDSRIIIVDKKTGRVWK